MAPIINIWFNSVHPLTETQLMLMLPSKCALE